jgi:AMMECR1 domain-containing protein
MESAEEILNNEQRSILLRFARQAVEQAAAGRSGPSPRLEDFAEALRAPRATFVTLTFDGSAAASVPCRPRCR